MSFKKIENLAHKKHAKLILTSLVACMGLGFALSGTTLTSANDNAFMGAEFHSPSTKLAQKTDLGQSLSNHKFESNQFTHLIVHGFKVNSDTDIVSHHSDAKSNNKFKLSNGMVDALSSATNNNKSYSDVSDVVADAITNPSDHTDAMTYFVTKHNLILREIFMSQNDSHALELVKYHLHSVANGNDNANALIFYPTEFQYKKHQIITIPKNKQSNYPIRLIVNKDKLIHHTHKKLLPDN